MNLGSFLFSVSYARDMPTQEPGICVADIGCLPIAVDPDFYIQSAVVILALLALAYLKTARTNLGDEQERLAAEFRAFRNFAGRVKDMEPGVPGTRPSQGAAVTTLSVSQPDELDPVRTAYRETVMAVDHYEDFYGESLAESVEAEFGPEVARQLTSAQRLTPQLQSELVNSADEAATLRKQALGMIRSEKRRIDDARSQLDHLERRVDNLQRVLENEGSGESELDAVWHDLADVERDCEEVLADHQRRLSRRSRQQRLSVPYLYRSIDVDYPALSATLDLVERVKDLKRSVHRATLGLR